MRVNIFLTFLIQLIIVFLVVHTVAISNTPPVFLQNPNQINGLPYVKLSTDIIEIGSDLTIAYGVRNDSDETHFLSGYAYNLILLQTTNAEINSSEILISSITTQAESKYTFNAYHPDPNLRYNEGNYTLIFESRLNSLEEFSRIAKSFQVISNFDANLQLSVTQLNRSGYIVNRTEHLQLMVENAGSSNALSVTIALQNIEQPVGLLNSTSSISYSVLEPQAKIYLIFAIQPERFGIGRIDFRLNYETSTLLQKSEFLTVDINITPKTIINFDLSPKIQKGNLTTFQITIRNQDLTTPQISHRIQLTVDATKIIYTPYSQEFQLIDILNITRHGNVIDTGLDKIGISIIYLDIDNVGEFRLHRIDLQVEIFPDQIVIPSTTFPLYYLVLLFAGIILLLLLLLGFLLFKQYFKKITATNLSDKLNKKIKYPSHKIIVDCANVAWNEPSLKKYANLKNLFLTIDSLRSKGFTDITCIADASLRYQVQNLKDFDQADKDRVFKVLPAKVSADLFILRVSQETNALILSNDLFKEFRDDFTWIDDRRVPFSIIDGQFFLHPISKIKEV